MNILDQMLSLSSSFESLGLILDPTFPKYDCTPKGARMIGHVACDGIHFCVAEKPNGLEAAPVFVVSPMMPDHLLEPIAENIFDFMALLLACKDASSLECISYKTEADFEELIRRIHWEFSQDQEAQKKVDLAIKSIKDRVDIEVMADVYAYVKNIQLQY